MSTLSKDTNLEKASGEPVDNPVARNINITLSIPDTICIKMVDASALADYEIWFGISSILASAVIGFTVPFFQSLSTPKTDLLLAANAAIFLLLFLISFGVTVYKRTLLRKKSREFPLKVSS